MQRVLNLEIFTPQNAHKLDEVLKIVTTQYSPIVPYDLASGGTRLAEIRSSHPSTYLEKALQQRDAYREIIEIMEQNGEYYGGMDTSSWVQARLSELSKGL